MENNFNFHVNEININVKKPEKNFKEWAVYINGIIEKFEEKFEKKFPHISLKEYTFEYLNYFYEKS